MAHWDNFYMMIGGAAATLIGLMFLSVTFGARLVTRETVGISKAVLSPILYHFAQAFLLACAVLVPDDGFTVLAVVAITISFLRLVTIPLIRKTLRKAHEKRGDIETSDWIILIILPAVLYVAFIVNGAALLAGCSWAYSGIALCTVAILSLGIYSAWDMLIWMAMVAD